MIYLTVHDLVWINTVVTGAVPSYDYVTLEACMAGQYRYGVSDDPLAQSAGLVGRLLSKRPFKSGNRRTAFVGTVAFLNANGYAIAVDDGAAASLIRSAERCERTPLDTVKALVTPASGPLPDGLTLRKLVGHLCNHHAEALKALSDND